MSQLGRAWSAAVTPLLFALALLFGAYSGAARGEPCRAPVMVEGAGVPPAVLAELRERAPALFERVAAQLALTSCEPVRVDVLPAIEGADALDPPWRLPGWAAGAAVPSERRIVIAVTASGHRQDRERILLHELAHVGVREAAGAAPVPRWLDEGFARFLAGEHSTSDLEILARARVGERLFPLAALEEGFPARGDLASLAYAQAGRAVSLLEAGQEGAVAAVLARLRAGEPVDEALAQVAGRRTWQLDVDVERSIPLWRAWAIVGLETDLALGGAALVCALAGWRARRRLRERMRALDGDDAAGGARAWALLASDVVVLRWTVRGAPVPSS
jgi:hypothetical protein